MIERVHADLTAALKAGDKKTANALRLLYSALKNAQIEARADFNEALQQTIVLKEMKKRVEARDLYAANNREELAAQEEFERSVYAHYVPEQMSANEIDTVLRAILESGVEPVFSSVMPKAMKELKGKADGKLVSERVKAILDKGK